MNRSNRLERVTRETTISATVELEGRGSAKIDTGIGFFDHMLELLAKHSAVDLTIEAKGDLEVDEHHTVEDVGLALGEALNGALGERRGIRRYGFLLPMDESLAQVAIDLGGRPYLVFDASFERERVGELPTELVEDFFKAVSDSLRANIHIKLHYGRNDHHKIEAIFKAFARALRMAIEDDPRLADDVPSTKGVL
jgi:imidazoleglycerol-phosphate dehydratase/histidinol-phosphatase